MPAGIGDREEAAAESIYRKNKDMTLKDRVLLKIYGIDKNSTQTDNSKDLNVV